MRRACWIVMVLASGCYSPEPEARCSIACTPEDGCPDGLFCSSGRCLAVGDMPCPNGGPACTMPAIHDDFNNGVIAPCGTWGTGTGDIQRENGALTMRPVTGPDDHLGCISTDAIAFDQPVFVELATAPTGPAAYAQLEVHSSDIGLARIVVSTNPAGGVELGLADDNTTYAGIPYVPATMRWLRLRAVDPTTIAGEYSNDRKVWIALGTVPVPSLGQVRVSLDAGTYETTSTPIGAAVFDNLDTCP